MFYHTGRLSEMRNASVMNETILFLTKLSVSVTNSQEILCIESVTKVN